MMGLSAHDKDDMLKSHHYRLGLTSSPSQSNFRVLALLFFEQQEEASSTSTLPPWVPQRSPDGRTYIVGTNDEPGYMGGAICAERAALVQLRFLPSFTITKLVIATDSTEPIACGMLCREFLAGHDSVPWDVPVLSTGCRCSDCGLKNDELFPLEGPQPCCSDGKAEHSIPLLQTTIRELYPFPSPYTRLNATQSKSLGETILSSEQRWEESLDETAKRLLELAVLEAKSNLSDLHPIQFGAAAMLENGSILTTHQVGALEYGCTLDAISQLASQMIGDSRPVLLVQADQYGVVHSPFAPARSFLSEYGYGDCRLLVHETGEDVWDIDQWSIRQISVQDLAPNPPAWTTTLEK